MKTNFTRDETKINGKNTGSATVSVMPTKKYGPSINLRRDGDRVAEGDDAPIFAMYNDNDDDKFPS